ncbi:sulfite exporter TauE/SafE family protein [Brucella tritici]|uniref:sulfite exporter TauE/SafE family protein n=1 Tax=Brucella tritici TaxID=94626 RepID=UPI00124E9C5E|nr:sulfite exporter TauE/SafE family protein [Brucella tritici]KAB2676613.1 sulfite exporter TauE/SafE family protein [Brucella tritici]
MTYSFSLILTIAVTFLGAGFVKGVTGMGLPTVAMGVLGALISPLSAASLLIIPSFITNLWQLLAGPSFGQLMLRLWSMMIAIAVGTIAGTAVLVGGNIAVTTSMLGSSLVIYAAYTLFARQLQVPERLERSLSPAIGLLTGLIAGATGVFVIPAVPYLQSLGFRKDDLVQSLGLSFTVSTAALALGLSSRQAYSHDLLLVSVLAVVPSLVGMFIGQACRRKIRPENFRRWFLIGLMILGLEMALRPLFSMS